VERSRPNRYTLVAMTSLPLQVEAELPPFAVAARRSAMVFGAPVELVLVPGRKARHGRATADRPALARSRAPGIVADEALWRGQGHVLTPNRYPLAERQLLLWPERMQREPDAAFWRLVGDWVTGSGGAALHNNIGAAATIARCHAHLVPQRLPFLDALPERAVPAAAAPIEVPAGITLVAKDVPLCLLGVRGSANARAEALLRLAEARLCAACNIVVQGDTAWMLPRRTETPAPHFPYALGAAELWGRWCYMDEAPFHEATAPALESALVAAGMPPLA
jgi:hypothetical protein